MDLGQGQSVRNNRLTEILVAIGDNVGCIEQARFRKVSDCTAATVCGEDSLSELRLMQSLLYEATCIPPLRPIGHTVLDGLPESQSSL